MTTPSGPPDPYTGQPADESVPTSSTSGIDDPLTERHPYTESDFGMTPRAIADPPPAAPRAAGDSDSTPDLPRLETSAEHHHHPVERTAETLSQWSEARVDRGTDAGIWVPAGFAVVAFAMLLTLVLFPISGVVEVGVIVVLIVALGLAALSGIDVVLGTRRRRARGEDLPHATGLE